MWDFLEVYGGEFCQKTTTRLLPKSTTAMRPSLVTVTPEGRSIWATLPGAKFDPKTASSAPEGVNTCSRWFLESATTMLPSSSMATPCTRKIIHLMARVYFCLFFIHAVKLVLLMYRFPLIGKNNMGVHVCWRFVTHHEQTTNSSIEKQSAIPCCLPRTSVATSDVLTSNLMF